MNPYRSTFQCKKLGEALNITQTLTKPDARNTAQTVKMPSLLTLFRNDLPIGSFESGQMISDIKEDSILNQPNKNTDLAKNKDKSTD